MKIVNFVGQRFGKLVALSRETIGNHYHAYWNCQCDCGTITKVRTDALRTALSCGCVGRQKLRLGPEKLRRYKTKHEYYRAQCLRSHGLTLEDYNRESEKQKHVCAICGKKNKRYLCVDHDHKTGKFRGLLCDRCNQGLGSFQDNPNLLKSAIQYLSNNAQTSPTPIIALQARNQETESPEQPSAPLS